MIVDLNTSPFHGLDEDTILQFENVGASVGANLGISDIFKLRNLIEGRDLNGDGVVILSGTDSLEEVSYGLDLILDVQKPVVITASMRPTDSLGYDGLRNFRDSVQVLKHSIARKTGVLVVISEQIHAARYVRKIDSQAISAFDSRFGSMGAIRRGLPIFHYTGLPSIRKFTSVCEDMCNFTVPVVPMYVGCTINALHYEECDGLVIAGMGTGSLPNGVIEELSRSLTSKIPVCITSRCPQGDNYDDFYYKGSLEKYESRGFILRNYEGLSPYQARLRLIFELAEQSRRSREEK